MEKNEYVVFILYGMDNKVKNYVDFTFSQSKGSMTLDELEKKMKKKFNCCLYEVVDETQIKRFEFMKKKGIYKLDDNNIVSSL